LLNVFVIATESREIEELRSELAEKGFSCEVASRIEKAMPRITEQSPEFLILELDGDIDIKDISPDIKETGTLPVIALVPRHMLDNIDGYMAADDFITSPYNAGELISRLRRLLRKTGNTDIDNDTENVIRSGDLRINLDKCKVTVSDRIIELTFREYELLVFLASSKGRVFNRDTLLNKVWGYDYYGGDRTVDVHVRRLRSKIEDVTHSYIDTVRNVGYRFREENSESI